jgi:hypothetical protein
MIKLTRRAFLRSIIALAAWAGLGPLQQVASRPAPPAEAWGFPLHFSARFLVAKESHTVYMPLVRNE